MHGSKHPRVLLSVALIIGWVCLQNWAGHQGFVSTWARDLRVRYSRSLVPSGSLKRDTKIYGGDVSSVAFLVDGKHVVGSGEGGKIRRWRVADGVEVGTPMEAESAVYSVAVSQDGKWIVSGTKSGSVQVWNAESGEKVTEFKSPRVKTAVREVDVSPDSTQIVSGSGGGTVFVWSLSTWKPLFGPWRPSSSADVLAVKFSPDGRLIATAWSSPQCVRVRP